MLDILISITLIIGMIYGIMIWRHKYNTNVMYGVVEILHYFYSDQLRISISRDILYTQIHKTVKDKFQIHLTRRQFNQAIKQLDYHKHIRIQLDTVKPIRLRSERGIYSYE